MGNDLEIVEVNSTHKSLVESYIANKWGSPVSVSRGRVFNTGDLPGFICLKDGEVAGLVTYFIDDKDCEIVTLNSEKEGRGLASAFIDRVVEKAKVSGSSRVWLVATNDNSHAIRFYQRRGFEWVAFHKDAMEEARKIKPEIAVLGDDDIPMKHELEFELSL